MGRSKWTKRVDFTALDPLLLKARDRVNDAVNIARYEMEEDVNVATGSLRRSIQIHQKMTMKDLRRVVRGKQSKATAVLGYGGKDYTGKRIRSTGKMGRAVTYVEPQELVNSVLHRAMLRAHQLYEDM